MSDEGPNLFWPVFFALVFAFLICAGGIWVWQWCWNYAVAGVVHVGTITYTQAGAQTTMLGLIGLALGVIRRK